MLNILDFQATWGGKKMYVRPGLIFSRFKKCIKIGLNIGSSYWREVCYFLCYNTLILRNDPH